MTRVAPKDTPPGSLLKPEKAAPKARKPMRKVSRKKAAYRASKQGVADQQYVYEVKLLPCVITGRVPTIETPNDAHHCKDVPPADADSPYAGDPGERNHRDAIPLAPDAHRKLHAGRATWRHDNGPDYSFIKRTRERGKERRESIDF